MKGRMVGMFNQGDAVTYSNGPKMPEGTGRIHKLHMSGSTGVAEIKPSHGGHKVSRRLLAVRKGV
jgi:hypothetical protein